MPGYDGRRYLSSFDYRRMPHLFTDTLAIGTGVAGMRAGIEAARYGQVVVLSKGGAKDTDTARAQGGVAAAIAPGDECSAHLADTLRVGCGVCNVQAAERLVTDAPERIRELIDWGAQFDREGDRYLFGLEGGHRRARILHARGDATGAEIARTVLSKAEQVRNLRVFEHCFAIDLLLVDGRCAGVLTFNPKYGHQIFWARQTILATGGIGRIYRESTNVPGATGDGQALAFRAGATLRAMEMVQFHPTTLYVAGASRALISEAVRGEGAYLLDRTGLRFMPDCHPDAELAPRDVVSRAILRQMVKTDHPNVYLDVRHIPIEKFRKRFPQISQLCDEFGIDVSKDVIPVRPASHYMIGGVAVDLDGHSSIEGLFAVGEAANSGVHGANRLASNSLLEGLVFGRRAGRAAGEALASVANMTKPVAICHEQPPSVRTELDLPDVANSLRSLMGRNAGIERHADRLAETLEIYEFWGRYIMDKVFDSPAEWEVQNMLTVGRLIARAALERTESRGVHYRADHPETDDTNWRRHMLLRRGDSELIVSTEAVA